MHNRILRNLCRIIAFAIMLLIFYSSSRTVDQSRYDSAMAMKALGLVDEVDDALDLSDAPMLVIHNALRKWAHHILYGMLGVSYLLIIYRGSGLTKCALTAFLLSVAYGASDELHQMFTGRGATYADIGKDATGAFIGIAVFFVLFFITERNERLYRFVNIFYDLEAD